MESQIDDQPNNYHFPVGIAGWLADDEAVLVYDNYDIWKLDPINIKPPINVTNSYGQKNVSN